jgi:hypothetical protein
LNCILQRNYINIQPSLASSDDYFPNKYCILQKSYALAVDISSKPKYAYKKILVGETKYYTTVHLEDLSVNDTVILQ